MQNVWTNPVVLNLYKHAEPLRSFPSFCRTLFLPNITESKNRLLQRWPWLAYYDVTTLLVIIQMTFVEPWNGSVEPEAQSALHFGVQFSWTFIRLFNRGTTFSQTVTYNSIVFLPANTKSITYKHTHSAHAA